MSYVVTIGVKKNQNVSTLIAHLNNTTRFLIKEVSREGIQEIVTHLHFKVSGYQFYWILDGENRDSDDVMNNLIDYINQSQTWWPKSADEFFLRKIIAALGTVSEEVILIMEDIGGPVEEYVRFKTSFNNFEQLLRKEFLVTPENPRSDLECGNGYIFVINANTEV